MNDELTLLASAYLDGDVTTDERARVENDPELLSEVQRLRSVRILLGDVEAPSISMREAQLATALDIWDRLPEPERTGARRDATPLGINAAAVAGAASVTAPVRLSQRRRTTSTRWLTGAAAALVLVLAGGIALQLGSDGADDAASTSADGTSDTGAETESQTVDGGEAMFAERATAADAVAPVGGALDDLTSDLDTGIADPAPPGENSELDLLSNTTDLADFASAAVGAPTSPDNLTDATNAAGQADPSEAETFLDEGEIPVCLGVDLIVGPAIYIDVPVVVGIDLGRNVAIAYRAATCAEVARIRLP
jgi:hypothetical protein